MVAELEATLRPYGARPHFGKLNLYTTDQVRDAYPERALRDFDKLRRTHDPEGKFQCELLRCQLDPSHCRETRTLY